MNYCTNCGTLITEGTQFCTSCGTPAPSAPAPEEAPPQIEQPPPTGDVAPPAGSRYEPISTWGFFGIMFLLMIPLVNLLCLLIWAFGGCRKVNKQNFAKAALIWMLIGVILSVLIGIASFIFFSQMGGEGGIIDSLYKQIIEAVPTN